MKKPLTKEEFLDKKNLELHRELLGVFNDKIVSNNISTYFQKVMMDNHFLICDIKPSDVSVKRHVTYKYQSIFIDLIEMLKSGELVFKNK